MIKGRLKKFYIVVLVITIFVHFLSNFIFATTLAANDSDLSVELWCYVKNVNNNFSNTYTYKIEKDPSNPLGATNEPEIARIEFNDTTNTIIEDNIANSTTINFSDVKYTKAGIYKYIITEIDSSFKDEAPISNEKYVVYVTVKQINGEFVTSLLDLFYDDENSQKTDKIIFNHELKAKSFLIIENYVVGDKVDPNKYFKIRVTLKAEVGSKYDITGQDENVIFEGENIKTISSFEITENENSFFIYLKHGQTAVLGYTDEIGPQIAAGTEFSVEVKQARKYQTLINDVITRNSEGTILYKYAKLVIVNSTDYDVALTGVFFNLLPYILLLSISIVSLSILAYKKIKKDKNESN